VDQERDFFRCWAEISTGAIRKNVRFLKNFVGNVRFFAVVKADAYGHGVLPVTLLLQEEGIKDLAVASPEEGIQLRENGCSSGRILVMGAFQVKDYFLYRSHGLIPTVSSFSQLKQLNALARRGGFLAECHLKVDSGMCRYGIHAAQVAAYPDRIFELPNLNISGLYSHLSSSSAPSDAFTNEQINVFRGLCDYLQLNNVWSGMRHLLNSGGILYYPHASFDAVRPGLSLYGYYPGALPRKRRLVQAMRFKAHVVNVRKIPEGGYIGYERTYRAKRDSKIALIAAGYADGYPVSLSNRGKVKIGRQLFPVVGRVCMDTILVDVTTHPVRVGSVATLWGGEARSVEAVAAEAGTIPYELTCRVSARVPRSLVR